MSKMWSSDDMQCRYCPQRSLGRIDSIIRTISSGTVSLRRVNTKGLLFGTAHRNVGVAGS